MPDVVDIGTAAMLLREARRVSVFGVSGAGKSTLSVKLADRLGLPHVSLDRDVRWLPGWTVRDRAEQRRLHDAFVATDAWVIDGTTISMMNTRLPRTEVAIWMRLPRLVALAGIYGRVIRGYGKVRPDMAEGCPEQMPDREFLRYIWKFEQRQSPLIEAALNRFAPDAPLVVIRSRREAARLLAEV